MSASDSALAVTPQAPPTPPPADVPAPQLNPNYVSSTNQTAANATAQNAIDNTAQPTQAPAPTQPLWKQVVMGALAGMAGSAGQKHLGGGLAAGAGGFLQQQQQQKEDDLQQQQAQSNIKFQSAQAAHMVIQAKQDDLALQNLPQEQQDQHAAIAADTQKKLFDMGISPTLVTDNSHSGATAGMQQLTAQQNGVPDGVIYNNGDTHSLFSVANVAQQPGAVKIVNDYLDMTGQPQRFNSLAALHASGMQEDLVKKALTFGHEVPTPETADSLATQAENTLKTYAAQPGADPVKSTALANNALRLRAASDHFQDAKATEAGKVAAAEAPTKIAVANAENQNKQAGKPVYAVDPSSGQTILTTSDGAASAGMTAIRPVTQSQISGDIHNNSVLEDVTRKANAVADTAKALDQGAGQSALISQAVSSDEFKLGAHAAGASIELPTQWISNIFKAGNQGSATPLTLQYINNVYQLREASMGLNKVLTGSSRASESQIAALQATLPGYEHTSGIALQKLTGFAGNIDALRSSIPIIPGTPRTKFKLQ